MASLDTGSGSAENSRGEPAFPSAIHGLPRAALCCLSLCGALWLGVPALAYAQSAADLQAAGAAFQEGQRAQLRGEHAQAAELFDLANHTAPSAAALRSSIRMHQAAGHGARAATLAADARTRYPEDAGTVALADEVLAALGPTLGHLLLRCEPACSLTVDGRAVAGETAATELFVAAGPITMVASWGARSLTRSVEAVAGQDTVADFALAELPPEPAVAEPVVAEPSPGPLLVAPPAGSNTASGLETDADEGGLSPVFFGVTAGLTAIGLGASIASGVDMLAARDAYVLAPTEAGWRDGTGRELRTNALLGTTIGLAAVTVGLVIFTDWGGGPTRAEAALRPRFQLGASHEGAYGALTLRF